MINAKAVTISSLCPGPITTKQNEQPQQEAEST